MLCALGLRCFRPEEISADAPSAFEDIGQDQHGHIATHAVALTGDALQLADHRLLALRVAVVELQRIGPAVKVRVATVGEHDRPVFRLHPAVVLRCARQISLAAMDKIVRVLVDPRMIRGHVVRDKIEHQLQSAFLHPLVANVRAPQARPDRDVRCNFGWRIQSRRCLLLASPAASVQSPCATRDSLVRSPAPPARSATHSGTRPSQNPFRQGGPTRHQEYRPSVARLPSSRESSVSQTRVLIW